MKPKPWHAVGSVLKQIEGGPNRAIVTYRLKELGLEVNYDHSIYIGHVHVLVRGDGRKYKSAKKVIFG